jgi:hypothetical protein
MQPLTENKQDCGWGELMDEAGTVLGRGRLFVFLGAASSMAAAAHTEEPAPQPGYADWRGSLDPLRLEQPLGAVPGRYRLRLENPDASGEDSGENRSLWQALEVDVSEVLELDADRVCASVTSADGVLPSTLRELGGN